MLDYVLIGLVAAALIGVVARRAVRRRRYGACAGCGGCGMGSETGRCPSTRPHVS